MADNLNKSGLLELPEDARDFALGAVFWLPELDTLPESHYSSAPLHVKDQGMSDFCTQYALCAASEWQENVQLEPSYTFAVAKDIQGDLDGYGCDLRSACKAQTSVGAIEVTESPYNITTKDATFLRNLECWPVDLKVKAAKHKKKSYFRITGPYDAFDNIRASIWLFRDKKQLPVIGVLWTWPSSQVKLDKPGSRNGGGHAILVRGWEGDYLVLQNSYGVRAGDHGTHLMHRDLVNGFVERWGAFVLVDMDQEEAKDVIVTPDVYANTWSYFFRSLFNSIKRLLGL